MTRKKICQKHLNNLGIKNEKNLKECIAAIFERHDHQSDVLIDIYKLVFPDWERIEKINGHPEVGKAFWTFVFKQFKKFDSKYHPKVFPGGLWFNTGFSSNQHLGPWELSFDNCMVIMS